MKKDIKKVTEIFPQSVVHLIVESPRRVLSVSMATGAQETIRLASALHR